MKGREMEVEQPHPDSRLGWHGAVDREQFRLACSQFTTGVVVVTATMTEDFGATVNAFTSLTLDPPQVLVCLADTSNTWQAISASGTFAVNVLADDQTAIAEIFASKAEQKLARIPHDPGIFAPLIRDALATFECRLSEAISSATHWMLVGQVERVQVDLRRAPALFFRSRMYAGFADAASNHDRHH